MSTPYTPAFYEETRDLSLSSAEEIVPLLLEMLEPRSVIDVGCGIGTWLSVFIDHQVTDVLGVDGPWVQGARLCIPSDRFMIGDLSGSFQVERQFDLALCLEVAEHIDVKHAEGLVDSLTRVAGAVAFSAAIPFQPGVDHVNGQWPEYWIELFARRGYRPIDSIRPKIWRNDRVAWWYAQNMLLFVRRDADYPTLRSGDHEGSAPFSLVHPKNYLRAVPRPFDPKDLGVSLLVTALGGAIRRTLRKRVATLVGKAVGGSVS